MQEYPDSPKIYENKRVILITGGASKWYEQAIFIVKKNVPQKSLPLDFVREAEGIIESYLGGVVYEGSKSPQYIDAKATSATQGAQRKKKGGLEFMLNSIMLVSCVVIFVVLAFQFL